MDIKDNITVKELEAWKKKIEKQIEAKKADKSEQTKLFDLIKNDHARHKREDGRKVFRGVVDYLECYVLGLPPIAKAKFYNRFGIASQKNRVTSEIVEQVKVLLAEGKTLAEAASACGVSTATCQKIKNGDYES